MSTVSVEQAALLMLANRAKVEALIQSGELPAAKIGKGYVMLERDVMAFIERQIVAQTADRMGVKLVRKGR